MNCFNYLEHDFAIYVIYYLSTKTKFDIKLVCKSWKMTIEKHITEEDRNQYIKNSILFKENLQQSNIKYFDLFEKYKPIKSMVVYSKFCDDILQKYNFIEELELLELEENINYNILSNLKNLKKLVLTNGNFNEKQFPKLEQLVELHIGSRWNTLYFLNNELNVLNLKKLVVNRLNHWHYLFPVLPISLEYLKMNNSFENNILHYLEKFKNLKYLKFRMDTNEDGSRSLVGCSPEFKNLKYLEEIVIIDLNNMKNLKYLPNTIKKLTIKIIQHDHSFKHLSFQKGLFYISSFIHLEEINIYNYRYLKQSDVDVFSNFPKLKDVKIINSDFDINVLFPSISLNKLTLKDIKKQTDYSTLLSQISCKIIKLETKLYRNLLDGLSINPNKIIIKYSILIEEDYNTLKSHNYIIFKNCNFFGDETKRLFKNCNHFHFINCE